MQSRRQVLKGAAVGLVLPVVGTSAIAAPAAAGSPIDLAMFDARFPEARLVGAALSRRGARTFGFDGDVTSFWYGRLDPQWRNADVGLAGVTTERALFVLEQLSWARGHRVLASCPVQQVLDLDAEGVAARIWRPTAPYPPPMQPAVFGAGQKLVAWRIGPKRALHEA